MIPSFVRRSVWLLGMIVATSLYSFSEELVAHLSLSDLTLVVYGLPGGTTAFPVGVGGVDFKNRSLTPTLDGFLEQKYLIKQRHKPNIFRGKPFIRISDIKGRWTALGFHIQQAPTLQRGYVSRGCIRMQVDDLQKLADLVDIYKKIFLFINWEKASIYVPSPARVTYAMRYKNFGTKKNPVFKRDEKYNLVIMEPIAIPERILP